MAVLIGVGIFTLAHESSASPICEPNFSLTTEDVGQGRSCAIATNNLLFLLHGQYSCAAGTCVEELVVTEPCQQHFGVTWTVWGYIRYKCNTGACASSQPSQRDNMAGSEKGDIPHVVFEAGASELVSSQLARRDVE